jgi:16S rRNA G1207 methylase RsmC
MIKVKINGEVDHDELKEDLEAAFGPLGGLTIVGENIDGEENFTEDVRYCLIEGIPDSSLAQVKSIVKAYRPKRTKAEREKKLEREKANGRMKIVEKSDVFKRLVERIDGLEARVKVLESVRTNRR